MIYHIFTDIFGIHTIKAFAFLQDANAYFDANKQFVSHKIHIMRTLSLLV